MSLTPSSPLGSDQLVEQPPSDRSSIRLWAVLLAGPVIWINHFMVVYLLAEAACAAVDSEDMWFIGSDALVAVTIAATVVAAAACVFAGWWTRRHATGAEGDESILAWAGVLLAIGSLVAVLAVGLPAAVLGPC
jgi:uncharacterized membrane protein